MANRKGKVDEYGYMYLGNFSATEPWHDRYMICDKCTVSWMGCWDNFQCPQCGDGELPEFDHSLLDRRAKEQP